MGSEVTIMKFDEMERLADYMAKSNLFGIKTKEQAISLMALSQAEGLHPAIAARDYHIVQGRPTLKADAMMARFQQAGGKVEWKDYTDEKVTGVFSHPQGGKVEISWTIEMAKKANLTGKDVWRTYPRQMLRARTISEGIRTIYPGVAVGIYVPEEAEEMVDITPEARSLFKNATLRNTWFQSVVDSFTSAKTLKELSAAVQGHKARFDELVENGNEHDLLAVDELRKRYVQMQERLKEEAEMNQEPVYIDAEIDKKLPSHDNAIDTMTIALRKFRDGKPKWEYWVSEAEEALNKIPAEDIGRWLEANDAIMQQLKVADEAMYNKVSDLAINRINN